MLRRQRRYENRTGGDSDPRRSSAGSFSFFLRDVNRNTPIYIPNYKVTVLPAGDGRCYAEVEREILSRKAVPRSNGSKPSRKSLSKPRRHAPAGRTFRSGSAWEETSRMFEISEELPDGTLEDKLIRPIFSSSPSYCRKRPSALYYRYALGRGVGVMDSIARHLDEGVLPIYHSELTDDDVRYHSVSFVSLAKVGVERRQRQGTHFLISDSRSGGRVFTETQRNSWPTYRPRSRPPTRKPSSTSGRKSKTKEPFPATPGSRPPARQCPPTICISERLINSTGKKDFHFSRRAQVFCISTIKGKPLCNEELAVLLQRERIEVNFYIPHEPVSRQRAEELAAQSFEKTLRSVQGLLERETRARRPYPCPGKKDRRDGRAGLLHLGLVTFGQEPDGTLAANVGVYSPIGTESAPIIQFYASMGLNDLARRALNYFIETQQENGKIENYNGYMVETGPFCGRWANTSATPGTRNGSGNQTGLAESLPLPDRMEKPQ